MSVAVGAFEVLMENPELLVDPYVDIGIAVVLLSAYGIQTLIDTLNKQQSSNLLASQTLMNPNGIMATLTSLTNMDLVINSSYIGLSSTVEHDTTTIQYKLESDKINIKTLDVFATQIIPENLFTLDVNQIISGLNTLETLRMPINLTMVTDDVAVGTNSPSQTCSPNICNSFDSNAANFSNMFKYSLQILIADIITSHISINLLEEGDNGV